MAYLPPAGVRSLTSDKLSHLPTMSEIPNPGFTEKMLRQAAAGKRKVLAPIDMPPLKNGRDEDWPRPHRPHYPTFAQFESGCSARCKCLSAPVQLGPKAHHIGLNMGAKDPRELPYGLPPDSYDCRMRSDWFDHWKEHMARYCGSFALWHQQFGEKYFYGKYGGKKCTCPPK